MDQQLVDQLPYSTDLVDEHGPGRLLNIMETSHQLGFHAETWADTSIDGWEAGRDAKTALSESIQHWKDFLYSAGLQNQAVHTKKQVHRVSFHSWLIDLRDFFSHSTGTSSQQDDALLQQISARLANEGHPGIIIRSKHTAGERVILFNTKRLGNILESQTCMLSYIPETKNIISDYID
jgi:hypothetical protein